jgi:hypothetical protein
LGQSIHSSDLTLPFNRAQLVILHKNDAAVPLSCLVAESSADARDVLLRG